MKYTAQANDETAAIRHRPESDGSVGPLWVITIAMGAFFGIAGLVMMMS
jgi:hypothetical protein